MNFLKGKIEILIIVVISLLSLFFWESVLVLPIKLFVVLIHESGHALMTILSGGSVESVTFSPELGGLTKSKGGNLLLIASAGYLGSLLVGALIFLSAENDKFRRRLTLILSVLLFLIAVNLIDGGLQIFLSLCAVLFLYLLPRYLPDKFVSPVLKFIGLTSCLYVISDIKQDLLTTTLRETDTQIIEYITGIPALAIGSVWFLISIIILFIILKREF